ncbi:MAG: cation:proton antiporter, partial [Bacillota bacterium]|nr:cation:proton antiporter [Bacillota bacterium]
LLIGIIFLVFILAVSLGKKAVRARAVPLFKDGTGQIMVKISFFILFAFICLAEALGVETILGAFIAGLVISIISQEGSFRIQEKMDVIGYGFFIPVFFINIGATFDISTVLHNKEAWVLIPVLLIASFANKIIPVLFMKKKYSWRNTLAAGSLLSSRLSLIIAAGAIALKMGLISDVLNCSLLLVAIISCTVSPLLFNALCKNEAKGIEPNSIEEMAATMRLER